MSDLAQHSGQPVLASRDLRAQDEAAMVGLGEALGQALVPGTVVFLEGQLGMGKTTLARGVLRAFGHRGAVKSPTYTLVEPYQLADRALFHFDLYRLGDPEELEFMGIRDYFDGASIKLLEWPERGRGFLPVPDLEISIELAGAGRSLHFAALTERGVECLGALSMKSVATGEPGVK